MNDEEMRTLAADLRIMNGKLLGLRIAVTLALTESNRLDALKVVALRAIAAVEHEAAAADAGADIVGAAHDELTGIFAQSVEMRRALDAGDEAL